MLTYYLAFFRKPVADLLSKISDACRFSRSNFIGFQIIGWRPTLFGWHHLGNPGPTTVNFLKISRRGGGHTPPKSPSKSVTAVFGQIADNELKLRKEMNLTNLACHDDDVTGHMTRLPTSSPDVTSWLSTPSPDVVARPHASISCSSLKSIYN